MAGRTVGNIEVTVDADTGKLTASLIRGGKRAGAAGKKAIESQLDSIEAKIEKIDTSEAAKKAQATIKLLKARIEAQLKGIDLGIDTRAAMADLRTFEAFAEATKLALKVTLSERDLAEINAEIRALTARQQALTIQAEADLSQVNLNVEKFLAEQRDMKIQVEADLDTVNRNIQAFLAEQRDAEVQFEADMAAINVDIAKFLNTRRTAEVQFEADLDQINRNIARLTAEQHTIGLLADLDEREFRRKIARLTSERHEAHIRAVLDLSRAEAALVALERNRDPLQIPVEGDFSDINSGILALRRSQAARSLDINVGADVAAATRDLQLLLTRFDGANINLKTEADLTKARATIAAFRALQENDDIEIPVNADLDALETALNVAAARLESGMGAAGRRAGSAFSGGAGQGLSTRMQAIIGGIVLLMEPAVVAIQGLGAAITSVASSAFSALAGAAGALAPMLAAAGASAATLVVGFQGMGDGLGAVTEEFAAATSEGRAFNTEAKGIALAMGNLAPAAQQVVGAFAELMPQFSAIRNLVQQNLFEGLDDAMRGLADDAIPAVGRGLADLATTFNTFFRSLMGRLETFDFAGIFAGLGPVVDSMLDAFLNLFDAIEPFLKAAAPAAQALARSFEAATASLSGMVSAGQQSGALTEFLTLGVESLKQWGGLAKAAGGALLTLFDAGRASGDRFVSGLTKIVEKFDTWMESVEGQQALAEFFASGERVMKALVPVLEGLKDAFVNIVTPEAIGRFEELATAVGEVLPVLGSLFEIIGDARVLNTFATLLEVIAQAIEPILPAVEELATAIGTSLSDVVIELVPFIAKMAETIGEVMEAITPLLPELTELAIVIIEAFAPIVMENIDNISSAIEAAVPIVELIIGAFTLWMQVLAPIGRVMGDVSELIGGAFEAIGTAIDWVVEKIKGFVKWILDIPLVGKALEFLGVDMDDVTESAGKMETGLASAADFTGGEFPASFESARDAMGLTAEEADILVGAAARLSDGLREAADAAEEELDMEGWRTAESAIMGVVDPLDEAEKAFERLKNQAKEADEAAKHLEETFSLLFDPAAKAAQSARDYQESLAGLTEAMQGGTEATSEREAAAEKQIELDQLLAQNADDLTDSEKERIPILQQEIAAHLSLAESLKASALGLDITTEAGREALAMGQELSESVFAQADGMIALGKSQGEAAVAMVGWREQAIQTMIAAGQTREGAEKLLETYNLTPDAIATTFIQSGMTDAQKQVLQLDADQSGLADSIETLISQPGISEAMKAALLLDEDYDGIPNVIDTEFKIEDNATPVVEPVTESLEDLDGRIYESDIITNDAATPVIDEATGKIIGYEQLEGVARLGVLDEATPVIDEATGKIIGYERLRVNATVGATDATQPVLDPLTATLEVYAGNTYEADIAVHDQATQPLTDVSALGEAFGLMVPSATIGVVDNATGVLTAAATAAGDFGLLTPSASLNVTDNATPAIGGAIAKGLEWGGGEFNATIGVDDQASGAIDGITGKLDTLFGFGGKGEGTVKVTAEGATEAKDQVDAVKTAVTQLDGTAAAPKITLPTQQTVKTQLDGLKTQLTNLDNQVATPSISLPTWFTVISQVGALSSAIRSLPDKSVSVTANVNGLGAVRDLDDEIDALRDKTVTITTRRVTEIVGGGMTGGFVTGGAMAGQMVTGPSLMNVGERGYDEAIIPLQLPLNRVDPSVRELAALLRGEGLERKPGTTRILNQYMTVNTVSQDPVAVATQVVNRSAMLAHN